MSKHNYPLIGRTDENKRWLKLDAKNVPKCTAGCGHPARYEVEIRTSHIPSENETVNACEAHKRAAHELLTNLYRNRTQLAKGSP